MGSKHQENAGTQVTPNRTSLPRRKGLCSQENQRFSSALINSEDALYLEVSAWRECPRASAAA